MSLSFSEFVQRVKATDKELVTYRGSETNHEFIRVQVSSTEPNSRYLPQNILWLQNDTLFRRVSRSPSGDYDNTWEEVTTVEALFATQIWDIPVPQNQSLIDHAGQMGNAHALVAQDIGAVPASGGKVTGPLLLRTADYADSEAVPRSWVQQQTNSVGRLAQSVMQRFNSFQNIFNGAIRRIGALERTSARAGYVHTQAQENVSWSIDHALNARVSVSVFDDEGPVFPSSISVTDNNSLEIHFAVPCTGRAMITPI